MILSDLGRWKARSRFFRQISVSMLVPLTHLIKFYILTQVGRACFWRSAKSHPMKPLPQHSDFCDPYVRSYFLTHSDQILHGNPCGEGRVIGGLQCHIQSGGPNAPKYFGPLRMPTCTCHTTTKPCSWRRTSKTLSFT